MSDTVSFGYWLQRVRFIHFYIPQVVETGDRVPKI